MRIIHVAGWYYPDELGGTEAYVAAISRRLAAAGHHVAVAAPRAGATTEDNYFHDGIEVFRYPLNPNPTKQEAQGLIPWKGSERLREFLGREERSVVHFHTIGAGIGLEDLRASVDAGHKVIFTSHSSSLGFVCQRGTLMRWGSVVCDGKLEVVKCASCALQQKGIPRPLARAIGHLPPVAGRRTRHSQSRVATMIAMPDLIERNWGKQRELYELVDHFVVLTESAASVARLNAAPPQKLVVNRLGVENVSGYRVSDRHVHSPLRLGYVGRFAEEKGVYELARALRLVPPRVQFKFHFLGPALGTRAKEILADLKSITADDDRVSFAPAVPPHEVRSVLEELDLLVCPSVCAEGGPTIAIEAQAAGTPVIGSRIGGIAELVTDEVNGLLLNPGDSGQIAEAITRVANEPSTVDRWRESLPRPRSMSEVTSDYLRLYST